MKCTVLATALGLTLTLPALAVPTTQASLDWGSLLLTSSGTVTWGSSGTTARAFVSPDGFDASAADASTPLSRPASGKGVAALGSADASTLSAALSGDWAGGAFVGAYPAQANTWRTMDATLQPGATLSVSVAYQLAEDGSGLAPGHQFGTTAYLWLWAPAQPAMLGTANVTAGAGTPNAGTLTVSWTNGSGAAADLQLLGGAATYLYVNAVPEPASIALWLGGLGALGWRARRGRS